MASVETDTSLSTSRTEVCRYCRTPDSGAASGSVMGRFGVSRSGFYDYLACMERCRLGGTGVFRKARGAAIRVVTPDGVIDDSFDFERLGSAQNESLSIPQ